MDSTDAEHLVDAKREFWFLLTEEGLKHCHVLVLANKHDQPEAMTIADIIEGLELDSIHGRDWCKLRCKQYFSTSQVVVVPNILASYHATVQLDTSMCRVKCGYTLPHRTMQA